MFSSLTEALISRCKQLARECEDITLVFDGGKTSRDNIEALRASTYHFITSVTVTHHADLLSVALSKLILRTDNEAWSIEDDHPGQSGPTSCG